MHSTLLTVAEVARQLRLARRSVYRWVEAGWIPAVRLPSGTLRIRADVLDDIVNRGAVTTRDGGQGS